MRALLRVGQYLRAHRGWATATFLCAALVTMVDLLPPWLIKVVIDRVIQDGQTGLLPWILLTLVGAYAVRHLVNGVRIYCNNALEQRVIHHLRGDVHRTLLSQSFSFFENRATGELMSRVTNDVENLERIFVDGIEHFLVAVLTLLGITVMMLTLNWKLALLALLPVPIIAFGMARFTTRIHALYTRCARNSRRCTPSSRTSSRGSGRSWPSRTRSMRGSGLWGEAKTTARRTWTSRSNGRSRFPR